MLWPAIILNAIVSSMLDGNRIAALLLMGGSGRRFGSPLPKQFHRLAGKSIYLHTLEAILRAGFFDEIVLSCHADWIETVQQSLPSASCPIRIAAGGASRQESSYLGLLAMQSNPAAVVIHDAVRPFVSQRILRENGSMALTHGAVDTCIPSADTLVYAPEGDRITSIPQRSELLRGQTPQSFSYPLILNAHRNTRHKDASDDCRLAIEAGHRVYIVKGCESNIKITSETDLLLAEHLFRLHLGQAKPAANESLQGKRYALVGGTGGIGGAIAKKLQERHAEVIPLSKNTDPALDLCNPASIQEAFSNIGNLDGLINCAGKLFAGALEGQSAEAIDEMLSVNLKGLILSCRLAPLKKGAHVINIASSSFSRGRAGTCVYSAAKAGVVNFTQGWAEERPDLHIHALIPQRTNTPMRRNNFPEEDRDLLLEPEAVAEAAVSLLQENSTGLLIEVKLQPKLTQLGARDVKSTSFEEAISQRLPTNGR